MSASESLAPLPDYSQQAGEAVTIFVLVLTSSVTIIIFGLGKPFTFPVWLLAFVAELQNFSRTASKDRYLTMDPLLGPRPLYQLVLILILPEFP